MVREGVRGREGRARGEGNKGKGKGKDGCVTGEGNGR